MLLSPFYFRFIIKKEYEKRHFPPDKLQTAKDEIQYMMIKKLSPFEKLLIKYTTYAEKNDQCRPCEDYQCLNAQTKALAFAYKQIPDKASLR